MLTQREIQILQAYFDCVGNSKKVREKINISQRTIEDHQASIMRKMGLKGSWIKALRVAFLSRLVDVKPVQATSSTAHFR